MTIGTLNEEGVNVDLYIPRKCHATNSLITSYDHSAVQLSIANVDANGVYDGTTTTLCIAGYLRCQGESDHAINHLAIAKGMMRIKTAKKPRAKRSKTAKSVGARGVQKGAVAQRAAPGQKGVAQRAAPGQKGAAAQRGSAQKGNTRKPQPQSQSQQREQKQPQRGARTVKSAEGGRQERGKKMPQTRNVRSAGRPRNS